MRSLGKILIIMMLAVMLGACTVRTADDGATSASDGDSVGIENPFIGGGVEEDDDIIISEGGSSGGSGSPPPAPTTPEYDPLEIVTTKFADCYQHLYCYQELEANGGSEHYEWTVTGLPDGISGSKYISGTTKASPGNYTVSVTLKDKETEESISKDLSLKVIKFIKEDIEIRVSQFVDGKWKVLTKEGKDYIPLAVLDVEKRRLKLEVTGVGMYFKKVGDNSGPSYKLPRASRFHWSVNSAEDQLSVFVPPADGKEQIKEGQTAYLMPWAEKNDLEFKALDIIASENNLENTEITVRDDFGNSASVTFGEIDIEETTFIKCNVKHDPLKISVPSKTDFSTDIFKDPAKEKSAITHMYAEGGVAPYKWEISNGTEEVCSHEKSCRGLIDVFGNARAKAGVWCANGEDYPDCSKSVIIWDRVMLSNDAAPAWEIYSNDLSVKLKDACGYTVYENTKLRIHFPNNEPISSLKAYARIGDACHTNANTELQYKLYIGGTYVAYYMWELNPIPCDDDSVDDAIKDAWATGKIYPNETKIVESKKFVKEIDKFRMEVTDTGGEPVVMDAAKVWFKSDSWEARPDEWMFSTGPFVMEGPDSKGLGLNAFSDWEPRYETIPKQYRFGGDEDDW